MALGRERTARIADVLAVALAISLPWSVSLTWIFFGLWLLALVPTLNVAGLRRVVATPAGGLPVLFWMLGLVGVYTVGSVFHVLLVAAIVLFLIGLVSGRRAVV